MYDKKEGFYTARIKFLVACHKVAIKKVKGATNFLSLDNVLLAHFA